MTWRSGVLVVAAAAAAAAMTHFASVWAGLVVAGLGGALAVVHERRRAARRRRFVDQLAGWADGTRPRSVTPIDMGELHELAVAATRAGEQIDAAFAQLVADRPWRRALVRALPAAAVLFGDSGYVVAANQEARDLLGMPTDGERTTLVAALGSAQLAGAVARTTPESGLVVVDAEVGGRLVRATITAVGTQKLVLVADRTGEQRVEDVRRNFVVNASHELKTPVAAIQAQAEALVLLARGSGGQPLDRDRIERVGRRLEQQSHRLAALVRDLLDLRRLEDLDQVDRGVVAVEPLVRQAVADLCDVAQDRGVTFDLAIEQAAVLADPRDVEITIRNLVANAVGYNVEGGTVHVVVVDDDPVEIRVADTGVGIPRADLGRVFERFYRVDLARSRETGGTGLGLAMVRHAVSRNGGSIEVDSLLGSGSVFVVRLPRATSLELGEAQGSEPVDVEQAAAMAEVAEQER